MQPEFYGNYVGERFAIPSSKTFNFELFDAVETESLNEVVKRFKSSNASQITDISHEEGSGLKTKNGKIKSIIIMVLI